MTPFIGRNMCHRYHTTMATLFHSPLSIPPLTEAQRRRGIVVSMADSFLILTGFFTFISFFALHFRNDLGFAAAAVGLVLGIRQIIQQGLDIFGGFFADRIGYRTAIVLGCLIRAIGFAGAGFAQTVVQLLLAAILIGVGGVFFDAAVSGALACYTHARNRSRIFTLQATLNNIGAALGPLLAFVIESHFGFRAVALVASGFFVWTALQAYFFLPDVSMAPARAQPASNRLADDPLPPARPMSISQTFAAIKARPAYVRVVVLLVGFWMIQSQMSLTVPFAGQRVAGMNGVALLIGLNAFLAIPLQYPLVRLAERRLPAMQVIALSTLVMAVGMALIFLASTFAWQIVGDILVTIGTLAIVPVMQTITAKVAPARALAAFYGFSVLGMGVGGGIGQYIGGSLYDLEHRWHLPWLMAAFALIVGAAVTFAIWRTASPTPRPAPAQSQTTQSEEGFDPTQSGIIAVR